MYEERLKLPLQRDSLEDAAMKVRRCSVAYYKDELLFLMAYTIITIFLVFCTAKIRRPTLGPKSCLNIEVICSYRPAFRVTF